MQNQAFRDRVISLVLKENPEFDEKDVSQEVNQRAQSRTTYLRTIMNTELKIESELKGILARHNNNLRYQFLKMAMSLSRPDGRTNFIAAVSNIEAFNNYHRGVELDPLFQKVNSRSLIVHMCENASSTSVHNMFRKHCNLWVYYYVR